MGGKEFLRQVAVERVLCFALGVSPALALRRFLSAAGLLLIALGGAGGHAAEEVLTTVEQVRTLSVVDERAAPAVRLRGIVTFHEPSWFLSFVQDATGAIYMKSSDPNLRAGTEVEVEGVVAAGNDGRNLTGPGNTDVRVRALRSGVWPEPLATEPGHFATGAYDGRWVEVRGTVAGLSEVHDSLLLDLDVHGEKLRVAIPRGVEKRPSPSYLRGLTVTVRGVYVRHGELRDGRPRFVLYTQSLALVEVASEALAERFQGPLLTRSELFKYDFAGEPRRARVRGRVVAARAGVGFFLEMNDGSDEVGRVWVQTVAPGTLEPGDVVEVVGRQEMLDRLPLLTDALFRREAAGPPPLFARRPAREVTGDIIHGAPILVEATLLDQQSGAAEDTLVLEDEGTVFLARLLRDSAGRLPRLERGMRLRVGGICLTARVPQFENVQAPFAFQLWLRDPSEVAVLQRPSWWTAQRIAWLLAAVGFCSLVALAWALSLRRKNAVLVAEVGARHEAERALQTAHDVLEERVEERTTALRREISARHEAEAILQERGRLASELHDTLEQGLTGIALQLDAAARAEPVVPAEAGRHLDLARTLIRQSKAEVRRSVWNLRSQLLDENDLPGALRQTARQIVEGTKVSASVEVKGPVRRLPEIVESNLLRLGQEALTNVLKHAAASTVRLNLEYHADAVTLRVVDDGNGFDVAAALSTADGHFGLTGMRERARRIGGKFEITSAPGAGTVLAVRVATAVVAASPS